MKTLLLILALSQPKTKDTIWRVQGITLMKCMCTGFELEYKGKRRYIEITYWGETPTKQMPNIKEGDSLLFRGTQLLYKNKIVPFTITRSIMFLDTLK